MAFPQLGYQYIRPLYPGSERQQQAARSGTELAPAGTLSSVISSMYGSPYAGYGAFLPYSAELPLFPQLGAQYELKDSPGVQHAAFAHHHPAFYPYGQYQFGDPSRPKNATRESTSTLKAWLNEHRKNPYPTKGEKIMLAIITKMTLTQVSTWFANARRRLKKENKMTWTPRNRSEDEDEDENIDLEKNDDDVSHKLEEKVDGDNDTGDLKSASESEFDRLDSDSPQDKDVDPTRCDSALKDPEDRSDLLSGASSKASTSPPPALCPAGQALRDVDDPPHQGSLHPHLQHPSSQSLHPPHLHHHQTHHQHHQLQPIDLAQPSPVHPSNSSNGTSVIHSPPAAAAPKPKLWSLAEIATSSDKCKQSCVSEAPQVTRPPQGASLAASGASPSRSPSSQSPFPASAVLSRPLYYASAFYPGYTNYSTFGHLRSHHAANSTAAPSAAPPSGPHFNGLNQTLLSRAEALAKEAKLRHQSQVELCKDSPFDLKKGMSNI